MSSDDRNNMELGFDLRSVSSFMGGRKEITANLGFDLRAISSFMGRSISPRLESKSSLERISIIDDVEYFNSVFFKMGYKKQNKYVFAINIFAPSGYKYTGAYLKEVFELMSYKIGDMDIYHLEDKKRRLFSIVDAQEPGTFDLKNINTYSTFGVTLYHRFDLGENSEPYLAFEDFIHEALAIARELGHPDGIFDMNGNILDQSMIEFLSKDIESYVKSSDEESSFHNGSDEMEYLELPSFLRKQRDVDL